MPEPTSLATSTTGAARRGKACFQPSDLGVDIGLRKHEVRQPQRQAIDQNRQLVAHRQRRREIARRFDGPPLRAAARAMRADARGHFVIAASAVAT